MDGKTVVRTEQAPAPFQGAPYSPAIQANGLVFVAGQLGFEPGSTEVVGPGIKAQTEQTINNLEAILTEAGSGLDRIVKTTVFLASLSDFQEMNEVYAGRIGDTPPARSTIEVAALPSGARVEIEAIAHLE
jgi:2-iminobutanoate/2-iminopropanoate deaminase